MSDISFRFNNQKNTGFTIVELLIVIVVIAIIATIAIVAYNGIQNRANISAMDTDLSNIEKKLGMHFIEYTRLPASTTEMNDYGFGTLMTKTFWSNHEGSLKKGQYRVGTGGLYMVNICVDSSCSSRKSVTRHPFYITYWDYRNHHWAPSTLYWNSDGSRSEYVNTQTIGPNNERPCAAEDFQQCEFYVL